MHCRLPCPLTSEKHSHTGAAVTAVLMAASLIWVSPLTAQSDRMELADLDRIVLLESPAISPSGEHVVLVAMRANLQENRYDGDLVLIDLATGEHSRLAPHRPGVGNAQWAPSGDRLAFVDPVDDGPRQLHVLPLGGGEARRLTEGSAGITFYRWSPDGRSIVFGRSDEAEELEGEDRHNRSFEVGPHSYLTRSAPQPVHLWQIPVDGGEAVRLTSGAESIVDFQWAPEGDVLVMEVRPSAHGGESFRTSLVQLNLTSRERRTLVPTGSFATRVEVSPSGRLISFHRHRRGELGFAPLAVYVLPRAGGEPRNITSGIDRSLQSTTWMPDESGVLVRAPDRTTVSVWLQPLEGPARRLDLGSVQPISDLSMSEIGRVTFIGTEPHGPPELYAMEAPGWRPHRVTSFNDAVASNRMGRVEALAWEGPEGLELTGVLIYPPDYQPGDAYPLVLNIHGGPMQTSTEGFSPVDQIFAAQGWLVFRPNYRGSNNQGEAFQRAVINDSGDGPARDIMSGVEYLKSRGLIDDSRIAVSGWSYGGYLTTWLAAHYDGWAAAVAGAAVTDWADQYASSDLNTLFGCALGGSPWLNGNAENYRRQSAITYADRIRTPTLILATTGDERVPVIQSYKLYNALRDNGVEVRFVAYPVFGHFPYDPIHIRDVYSRWTDWIRTHFESSHSP